MWNISPIAIILAFFGFVTAIYPNDCNNNFLNPDHHPKTACTDIKYCQKIKLELEKLDEDTSEKMLKLITCDLKNKKKKVCCPHNWIHYEPMCEISVGPKIMGGTDAEPGAWPWAVLIGRLKTGKKKKEAWKCGGTLISRRHILTTGHCKPENITEALVRLGELDWNNTQASSINIPMEKFTVYPKYDKIHHFHDIAVVKLVRDVEFTRYINPICLPFIEDERYPPDFQGRKLWAVGWGAKTDGYYATHLQQLEIPVVNTSICTEKFHGHQIIRDNIICAGYLEGGRDTCSRDSGGPLMLEVNGTWTVVGITSYGNRCALKGWPAVYTKVASYVDWIKLQLED